MNDNTEGILHEQFWRHMQNAVTEAEVAIRDARGLLESALKRIPETDDGGFHYLANDWLDRHGRNRT